MENSYCCCCYSVTKSCPTLCDTMASGPITSWQIEREKVEAVTDFTFLGSKITEDGDCSHENKRR